MTAGTRKSVRFRPKDASWPTHPDGNTAIKGFVTLAQLLGQLARLSHLAGGVRVANLARLELVDLGSGRNVASGTEAPNMLANLVWSG
jgi:hypothetical protein